MHRIGQHHRYALLQNIEDRLPIRTRTLDHHMRTLFPFEPFPQSFQLRYRGIVLPLLDARALARRTGHQTDHDISLADIDTGTSPPGQLRSSCLLSRAAGASNVTLHHGLTGANEGVPSRQPDRFVCGAFAAIANQIFCSARILLQLLRSSIHPEGCRYRHERFVSYSLKHGLASGEMIIPGEDSAAFEALRHALLEDHRPANETEELLVTEMAQSWWLTQRAIRFQNECFTETGVDEKRLALFLRYQTTHERAFHKALNTLIRLKQNRARQQAVGFVSHSAVKHDSSTQSPERSDGSSGFVSHDKPTSAPPEEFVRQNPIDNTLPGNAEVSKAA